MKELLQNVKKKIKINKTRVWQEKHWQKCSFNFYDICENISNSSPAAILILHLVYSYVYKVA